MIKNLLGLMLVVFGIGLMSISAQTENNVKTISKGVVNGLATSLPKPSYPPGAKAVEASGTVNVQVLIDENGNVISATAVSGHPLLRQSSEEAARAAKFKPTRLGGETVRAKGVIVYNFVAPSSSRSKANAGNFSSSETNTETADTPVKGKGTILNGLATNLVKPEYPIAARSVKASGAVNIEVVIDKDGNVERAKAISGHPLLRQPAVKAALQSKFKPTVNNGQPVKVNGIIVFNFVP